MLSIALFAEGHTDQLVIEQILLGALQLDEEPELNFVQPLAPGPNANGSYAPGGWTVLFKALAEGKHREALQTNDLMILHVDTDVCDEIGFNVPKVADADAQASAVQAKLCEVLGADFCEKHGDRVVFAIAVDEVECWFMPLLFRTQKAKRAKTTGCVEAANRELGLQKRPALLRGKDEKNPKAYAALAKEFHKSRRLEAAAPDNPSLNRFVMAWKAWQTAYVLARAVN